MTMGTRCVNNLSSSEKKKKLTVVEYSLSSFMGYIEAQYWDSTRFLGSAQS